jgi:hypothetical protein
LHSDVEDLRGHRSRLGGRGDARGPAPGDRISGVDGRGPDRAAIDAYKGAADVRERWVRVLHLDRISPMLGLDAAVIRRQLVEALRNNLELLTDEQRDDLRQELDAMAEHESADELPEDWRQLPT